MSVASRESGSRLLKILLAVSSCVSLFVLVTGAVQTSAVIWAGLDSTHLALARSVVLIDLHRGSGYLLFGLVLLCGWVGHGSTVSALRWLTTTALVAGVIEALSAGGGQLQLLAYQTALHAICGNLIFSCLATSAVFAFTQLDEPIIVPDGGFPLVSLAAWIPPLVLTQVSMGAFYRHNLWGVMPHMAGAMLVAFLLVSEGVILLQKAPEHRMLHRAGVFAITTVLIQISLGIADFLMRLLDFQDSVIWLVLSVSHVTVAALVFTASLCLAMSVMTYVGTAGRRSRLSDILHSHAGTDSI